MNYPSVTPFLLSTSGCRPKDPQNSIWGWGDGIVFSILHAFFFCFFWAGTGPAGAQTAPSVIQVLQEQGYAGAAVGVHVRRLDEEGPETEHNADSGFVPASVAKLVTATAAYELLGVDYRFGTEVYYGGELAADSGILDGPLYVRGGGDPGFIAERLWLFVQHLRHLGLREIRGDCILDDTFFDSVTAGPGFTDDNSSRAYEAPVGALTANFNSLEIHARPGPAPGSRIRVDLFPRLDGIPVHVGANTVGVGGGQRVTVRTEAREGVTHVLVNGSMGAGSGTRTVYRKAWETTGNFGRALSALLRESGIRLEGRMRTGAVPDSVLSTPPVYVFEGQPLPVYVGYLFKYSNNIVAESIFKTIAAEHNGRRNGSWDSAAAVVRRWWSGNGLPGSLRLVNGSGMGTRNRLTPSQVVGLLSHVYRQKHYYPDFCAALSNAGIDGTLSDRFTRSRLRGLLRAKTGTLNSSGVSSLAGYAFCDGGVYAFAIMVNDRSHGQYQHWVLQQRLLEAVLPGEAATAAAIPPQ